MLKLQPGLTRSAPGVSCCITDVCRQARRPKAIGFTVETPAADVVDFGTEFSVDVAGGASEVHVFEGLVQVQPRSTEWHEATGSAVDLRTSQAVMIDNARPSSPSRSNWRRTGSSARSTSLLAGTRALSNGSHLWRFTGWRSAIRGSLACRHNTRALC
jgi:ferric-dicitrate binding protein FerR (iron transport regulator)